MPSFTANRGYEKPTVNGDPSTWGGFLNRDLDLLDQNLSGSTTIDISGGGDFIVSSDQIAHLSIVLTAPDTDTLSHVLLPAIGGFWFVRQAATATATYPVIRVVGNVGNGVVLNELNNLIWSDGANVYRAASHNDTPIP